MALNVSSAVKQKYLSDEFNGDYVITIGSRTYSGSNVHQGSVEIVESLCSGENFDLSAVEMSEISFTLLNFTENISNLQGQSLSMIQKVAGEDVPLGTGFTIVEAQYSGEYLVDVKAYDKLYAFSKEVTDWWNNTVTFPITHRDLLISLCTYCGVPCDIPTTYCNSTLSIIKAIDSDTITGLDVLGWLQEVSASFYRINRYGVLVPRTIDYEVGLVPQIGLYPADNLYPADFSSDPSNFDHEYTVPEIVSDMEIADFNTARINKLQVSGTIDDIGVIVGTGNNCYKIVSNALLFGLETTTLEAAATNIFDVVTNVRYRPFTAKLKGLPYLETGDFIKITTLKGIEVYAPILRRIISGSGLAYDSLECKGAEKRIELTATNKDLKILKQRTHEIINTIEEFSSTITNVESQVSGLATAVTTHTTQIAQNSNEISIQAQYTGTYNLLTNGDFTELGEPTAYWELQDCTAEYVDDELFNVGKAKPYAKGKALKLTSTPNVFCCLKQTININKIVNEDFWFLVTVRRDTDETPTFTTSIRIKDKDGNSLGWYRATFETKSTEVVNCRQYFRKSYYENVEISTIEVFVQALRTYTEECVYYVNNCCAFFSDETPPFWSWTNMPKNNLISQINVAPEGVKIQGEKIDIYGLTTFHNSDGTGGTTIDGATIQAATIKGTNSALDFVITDSGVDYVVQMKPASGASSGGYTNLKGIQIVGGSDSIIDLSANTISFEGDMFRYYSNRNPGALNGYILLCSDSDGFYVQHWTNGSTVKTPLRVKSSGVTALDISSSAFISIDGSGYNGTWEWLSVAYNGSNYMVMGKRY